MGGRTALTIGGLMVIGGHRRAARNEGDAPRGST